MSELLAIFGPTDTDSELLTEIVRQRPGRVTVLIEGADPDWATGDGEIARAMRERMAALLTLIERRTGATVVGTGGDRAQFDGVRFDRELCSRMPVAA